MGEASAATRAVEPSRRPPRISVVLPTYNEAGSIEATLAAVGLALEGIPHEILVVDDDSPDGTWRLAQRDPRVRVIRRVGERGLATAVIAGIREATGEHVAVMDADGQHPPEALPRMLAAAEATRADVVVASRHAAGGEDAGLSRARLVASWGAALLARLALPAVRRAKVRDPMSGFFLVRRDALRPLDALHPRGYKILLEVLVSAQPARVVEVPFRFAPRETGVSKLSRRVLGAYVAHLVSLARRDGSNKRFARFALVGLSGMLVNLLPLALAAPLLAGASPLAILLAGLVAREGAVLWNFAWNDAFTFRDRRASRGLLARLARWHVVTLAATIAYLACDAALLALRVPPLPAAAAAILVGLALNWRGADAWTYSGPSVV
ncbi:MAG: dolichol-phosphate mannosyltransferase [Thermoplasmata archaeon]|jgi:dolichol-phosphate mannosyltransferase|nr:dolichol-phosphate mannosyltransferase [Thermoplasmata archaeon]